MIVFVIGGSGSGKSAYAEKRLLAMEAKRNIILRRCASLTKKGKSV